MHMIVPTNNASAFNRHVKFYYKDNRVGLVVFVKIQEVGMVSLKYSDEVNGCFFWTRPPAFGRSLRRWLI
jgi:hypothetical protein